MGRLGDKLKFMLPLCLTRHPSLKGKWLMEELLIPELPHHSVNAIRLDEDIKYQRTDRINQ
jgi:hypothetical protein